MVRGPSALLAPPLALIYFLLAPALPALSGDARLVVCGAVGLLLVGVCGLAALEALRLTPALVGLVLGAGLVAAALAAAGVGPPANPFRALMAGALGALFARTLPDRRALVALPLLVAGIDAWSVLAGPSATLIAEQPRAVDFLTFDLPTWGAGVARAGQLGVSDVVLIGMYATWARMFGLRVAATEVALLLALVMALVVADATGSAIPVLPLLAAALLVVNGDRIAALFQPTVSTTLPTLPPAAKRS